MTERMESNSRPTNYGAPRLIFYFYLHPVTDAINETEYSYDVSTRHTSGAATKAVVTSYPDDHTERFNQIRRDRRHAGQVFICGHNYNQIIRM